MIILILPAIKESYRALQSLEESYVRIDRSQVATQCLSEQCVSLMAPSEWTYSSRPIVTRLLAQRSAKVLEFNGVNKEYMLNEDYKRRLFSVYRNAEGRSTSLKAGKALEQSLLLPPPLRERAFIDWCLREVVDSITFEQILPNIH